METEGSLPHSQVPATCPYPQPAQVHTPTSHFLKIHTVLSILELIQRCRAVLESVPIPKHSCEIGGTSMLVGSLIFTLHLYFNFSAVLDVMPCVCCHSSCTV